MTELTIPQIEEIAARAAKATPGPWDLGKYGAVHGGEAIEYTNGSARPQVALATLHQAISPEERDTNARLIAAARADVPALCSTALSVIRERDALRLAIETAPCDRGCWGGTIAAGGTDEKPNRHAHLPKCWKSQIGAHG